MSDHERAKPGTSDLERAQRLLWEDPPMGCRTCGGQFTLDCGQRRNAIDSGQRIPCEPTYEILVTNIASALAEARRAERERCAQAVEMLYPPVENMQQACAAVIRALPNNPPYVSNPAGLHEAGGD